MSPDETTSAPAAKAGLREWLGLAVLALPTILLALDFTVLHLALPHLAADLAPTSAQQLWILDIYGFMIAGFLITMGTLGDRIGRRRLLMIGAVAFGGASLLAAYSTSAEMLIASRALLGVAGATLMPSTLSLITNMFHDPKQRGVAVAVWLSCFSAGGAIGPMVGGVMLQWFWWGSVFLMGVPVMVVLLVAAPLLLPEFRDPTPGRLDLFSVALSLAAILPVVYAIKEAAAEGWNPVVIAMLVAGVVFGWLFVRRQRRLESPLMDLALFRLPPFTVGLGGLLLGTVVLGAFVLLFAQYLQLVLELSPAAAGLWMVPYAVANIAGAMLAPLVAARLRAANTIALGLLVAAVGLIVFTLSGTESGPLPAVLGSMLVTFGLSPLMVLVIDLVIASAPKEKSGSASSMSETCSEIGMAMGIATLGALGTAVYRFLMVDAVPTGVPSDEAAAVRDSLPGAMAATEDMEPSLAAQVSEAAEQAFMSGLSVVGYTGVAIVLGVAVITFLFLRDVPEAAEEEQREEQPQES
ncbi:MFS transporter [Nocardiopsis lambiniae]|uniref:MFS transporter n=1 Tax=Nocardiopsis lambiniae TaxID=3075539 RepID=A0ABU2MC67_9ACTN|nr:MFS transporter [Nocardiopsis sp. DSM 44743]MDT0329526.1 MFS transporter [Nocardiopsis sp. DSM 44743]